MSDVIELARSSRSRCRECRSNIEEGDLRFGSDLLGLYSDSGSDAFAWYHLKCAARRMPERLLSELKTMPKSDVDDYDALVAACQTHVKKAASKFPYGERAATGRARCIKCNEPIAKDALRVAVEREIATGAFTRMGAGYLHPACAVAELGEPNLGEILANNSSMLSRADAKELSALCDAAAASSPPSAKKAAAPDVKPAPREDEGADMVLADTLMDRGDVRGELIALEAQLASTSPADERWASASARVEEIRPLAAAAWKKELKKTPFELDRGFPAIVIKPTAKATLPDEPWVMAVHVAGNRALYAQRAKAAVAERALASLVQTPSFSRVRRLKVERTPLSWDGLRGLCSCDEVKNLESLDLRAPLGPRAMLLVLNSTRFERLVELRLQTNHGIDPDVRGFEAAAGLRALKRLSLHAFSDVAGRFVHSPLAQRLEALTLHAPAIAGAKLPNLEQLALHSYLDDKMMSGVLANESLAKLEFLDLRESFATSDTVHMLASRKALPSLRAIAIKGDVDPKVVASLRERFGDKVVVTPVAPRRALPANAKVAKGRKR